MIVVFFTDYKEEGTGIIVNDLGRIARNYFQTFFIVDFLSVIPFYEIIKSTSHGPEMELKPGNVYTYYHLLFLIRLLRVYKVYKLFATVNFL